MDFFGLSIGGDEGDRTLDLRIANATLSQLSYVPTMKRFYLYSLIADNAASYAIILKIFRP